ncbi:F-BAR domain only protein 2 isoform X1 [Dermatophagoides pteronyssinus]|uniref:F-BAR domain only protein 2 isoform X1 n=1 Tax=Dermatophagoides pteronyssinus TaxID=6956 RepID=UPI003F664D30
MTVDFQNHFWGDKQSGFDVLYQNLKFGSSAVKELSELLRSRAFLEEYNNNFLTKLSRKANSPQLGTFQPIWQMLKLSTEKLSSVHLETLQRLNQLIKEINKYSDEHHRKQKQIKNEEISTIEAINELKETVTALNKAKEFYYSKTVEIDRLRKENASQKDIEKAETRANKACVEYQNLIEKYRKIKEDFEKKFCHSCQKFQKIEESHINEMKNYLTIYSEILESGHALMGQVYKEFRHNFTELSTTKLLETFINSKATGSNRPAVINFEEANLTNSANQISNQQQSATNSNTAITATTMSGTIKKDLIQSTTATNTNVNSLFNSSNSFYHSNDIADLFPTSTQSSNLNDNLNKENNTINNNNSNNSIIADFADHHLTNSINNHLLPLNLSQSSSSSIQPPPSISVSSNHNFNNNNNSSSKKDEPEKLAYDNDSLKSYPKCYSTINSLEGFVSQSNHHMQNSAMICDTKSSSKDHHKSFPDLIHHHHHHLTLSRTPKWFLRGRKDKKNKNKQKNLDEELNNNSKIGIKSDSTGDASFMSANDINSTHRKELMIDSEGYTIRPPDPVKDESFSSSDSDSDADEKEKKIFVKINPLSAVTSSSSVDNQQLVLSAAALTLAPSLNTSRRSRDSVNPSPSNQERSTPSIANSSLNKTNNLLNLFSDPPKTSIDSNVMSNIVAQTSDSLVTPITSTKIDRYAAFSELSETTNTVLKTSDEEPIEASGTTTPTSSTFNVLPLPPKSSDTNCHSASVPSSISGSILTTTSNSLNLSCLMAKSTSASSFNTNSFSVFKPQQPTPLPQHQLYRSQTSSTSSMTMNGMMSRAESMISLSSDFRMTPISLCSSRDSSPLTIGMSDTIPVALAFQESVGSCFKGVDENLSRITIIGCIKIAFSAGIVQILTSNPYLPQLTFKLKHANRLEKIILSNDLVVEVDTKDDYIIYEMNMNNLQSTIQRLHNQSPNARYYNLDIIKYQAHSKYGAKNAPLQLVSHWKCDENHTNLKIDYKYNPSAFVVAPQPLRNVLFTANIDSNVISMVSQPFGKWDSLTKQATWKYPEISQTTENSGLGSIKAKFDIANGGPSCPSSVYVQFQCIDTILSGVDFELIGNGFRLSLVKRQFCTGRYYCEPGTITK